MYDENMKESIWKLNYFLCSNLLCSSS